jgi:Cap4 dsDNA endonuclease
MRRWADGVSGKTINAEGAKEADAEENAFIFPSVDDAKPLEEGGPEARKGFNYQDEIAVAFFIDMLETPSLLKVHCETHDDILLVHAPDGPAIRIAEFVQVKASEPDKLWSVADLCQRKKSKAGTSIFERSLARDQHQEESRFRLVTLRPVVSALEILTFLCGAAEREPGSERVKALVAELEERFPKLESKKGNGASHWIQNCHWDQRHSEDAVRKDNLLRLIQLSVAEGRTLLPEQAELLLTELRRLAKAAADAKWEPDRDKKIITRTALRGWWETRADEIVHGAGTTSGGKPTAKMTQASLPEDLIKLAVDLRRDYAATSRTPRYLETGEGERLQSRVKSEVMSLRARLVSGQLDLDGTGFHSLCVDRMDAVNAERHAGAEDRAAFLKGCMYDIADRCMLRFVRPSQ